MNGLLIINKPPGFTSHDVVARVRRILKTKRVGHTGTLDPFATGVLVILVGQATRLAQFLDKDEKEYEAVVRFGTETDTGDQTGSPKSQVQSTRSISIEEIERILPEFRGEIRQIPPMYSAKKIEGKKLYELARKGIAVERKPVKIKVSEIEVYELSNSDVPGEANHGPCTLNFGLKVACSAGTYIRTLAEDIGRKVGAGAHLAELTRTRAGKFLLSDAATLEDLEKSTNPAGFVLPMSEAIEHLPKLILNADRVTKTKNGLSTRYDGAALTCNQPVQMVDEHENLIAVGFYDEAENSVHPKVVLS